MSNFIDVFWGNWFLNNSVVSRLWRDKYFSCVSTMMPWGHERFKKLHLSMLKSLASSVLFINPQGYYSPAWAGFSTNSVRSFLNKISHVWVPWGHEEFKKLHLSMSKSLASSDSIYKSSRLLFSCVRWVVGPLRGPGWEGDASTPRHIVRRTCQSPAAVNSKESRIVE